MGEKRRKGKEKRKRKKIVTYLICVVDVSLAGKLEKKEKRKRKN